MANIFDEDISGDSSPTPPAQPRPRVIIPTSPFDEDISGTAPPPPKGFVPTGEMRTADPQKFSEWLTSKLQDVFLLRGGTPDPYGSRKAAEKVIGLAGMVPPMGAILAGGDLLYDLPRGNFGHAALDALGAVPGAKMAQRLVQRARGELPMARLAETPTRTINPQTGVADDELLDSARAAYRRVATAPIEYHPQAIEDYAARARSILSQPGGGSFTPESAPAVHATFDRWVRDMRARGGAPITPYDFDTLRGQLRSFTDGPDSVAGQRAASILDRYMFQPPPGAVTRAQPGALDTLRRDLEAARGDWRAGKTAETVEKEIDRAGTKAGGTYSGLNVDNTTRQRLGGLTTTDAGEAKIFGATYPEKQAINAVVAGDPLTNRLRLWGNRLGGGGGWGQSAAGYMAGSAATAGAGLAGLDPLTSMAIGTGTGFGVTKAGSALRGAANERTVRAAEEVVNTIRRNSPFYRAREAISPPIVDPLAMQRDAVAYALIPQIAKKGHDVWDQAHVPYEEQ